MSDNPKAFPHPSGAQGCDGMTLRDWFAGQALAWCMKQDYGNDWGKQGKDHAKYAVKSAYRIADAMLAERSKP